MNSTTKSAAVGYSKQILLVEDNQDDATLTLRALKKCRIDAAIVRDGQEALDYLFHTGRYAGEQMALPQIILLDLKLPKINGLEVLRRLRSDARTKLIPVTVFSSSMEERDVQQSYKLGANSYICKPVDYVKLSRVIRRLGKYWLQMNIPPQSREEELN